MYHLFIALDLPEQVKQSLQLLCGGLPGVLWQEPRQFHLTLRFVGTVDGGQREDIQTALNRCHIAPFDLELQGVGFFPHRGQPEKIWVGTQSCDELVRLRNKIEAAVVTTGLPPERRKFSPHVTLGKFGPGPVKSNNSRRLADYLSSFSLYRSEPFTVTSFILYSSVRSHQGPQYSIESEYSLSRQGGVTR